MEIHRYDVLIVGAGGAGMRAALESTKRTRTAVLTKLYPTRSHTGAAQGGMCATLANLFQLESLAGSTLSVLGDKRVAAVFSVAYTASNEVATDALADAFYPLVEPFRLP